MPVLSKIGFLGWAGLAAAAAVAGALVMGSVYQARQDAGPAAADATVPDPPAEQPPADPQADPPASALSGTPPPTPATPPGAMRSPPGFDVVRIAPDGGALVAGVGAPGAGITLRVDGEVAAQAAADDTGQFVAIFVLPPAAQVQIMTLEMVLADGRVMPAADSIVLAPRLAPGDPEDGGAEPTLPALAALGEADPAAAGPGDTAATPAPTPPEGAAPQIGAAAPEPDAPPSMAAADPSGPALPALPEGAPALALAPDAAPAVPLSPDATAGTPAPLTEPTPAPPAPAATPSTATPAPDSPAPHDAPVAGDAGPAPGGDLPLAFMLREGGDVALLDRAPQVADNVVIDMIGYTDFGDVQISGRAARDDPDGVLRLYLNNEPIALAQARGGDWQLDLPQIDPGVYTLRVDQLGAQGRVVSRFETPFQRETPERVAQARAEAGLPRTEAQAGAQAEGEEGAADPAPVAGAGGDGVIAADRPEATTPETRPEPQPGILAERSAPGPLERETAPQATAPQATEPTARPGVTLVTVQPGQSLWRISDDLYGDGVRWVQIFRANRDQIRNPDLIYPGQVFTLPD